MKHDGDVSLWSALYHFRRPILRATAQLAAVVAAGGLVLMVLEIPFYPWARSFTLWPTLTGDWHGDLLTPAGRTAVFLEMHSRWFVGFVSGQGRHSSDIGGRLKWCDGSGAIWEYEVWGDVENWRGTRFHLRTRGLVERDSGESPGSLTGEWHGDAIEAVGTLWRHERTATATATAEVSHGQAAPEAAPSVRYALRRGSEANFLAACRKLGTSARGAER